MKCLNTNQTIFVVYIIILVFVGGRSRDALRISLEGVYRLPLPDQLSTQTYITMNIAASNTLSQFWGSNSLTWRPYRWITKDEGTMTLEDEQICQPQYGVFIPFSSGPRACPGKKFAQVEFVAVIARLFRRHRCPDPPEQGDLRPKVSRDQCI